MFTGFDILFFWIIKMVLMSSWLMKSRLPFKSVIVHPVICDSAGAKMSKTKANVVNPKSIVNAYGLGATCFYMANVSVGSQHFKMCLNLMVSNRNVITKLWNLMRVGCEVEAASLVCRAAVCKLTACRVYTKLVRVSLQIRRFDFECYSFGLVELVKQDLNGLAKVRNVSCKCVSNLACCVWRFYFSGSNCFRMHSLYTRFSKAAKLSRLLVELFVVKANIVTNCVRLFSQARELALELATANVYYIRSLRVSRKLEARL